MTSEEAPSGFFNPLFRGRSGGAVSAVAVLAQPEEEVDVAKSPSSSSRRSRVRRKVQRRRKRSQSSPRSRSVTLRRRRSRSRRLKRTNVFGFDAVPQSDLAVRQALSVTGCAPPSTGAAYARMLQVSAALGHDTGQRSEDPSVCIQYLAGKCGDAHCPRRHPVGETELAKWRAYFKRRVCKWGGGCRWRPSCIYGHPEDGILGCTSGTQALLPL